MFKIGDKVKCVNSYWDRIKVGRVYTVTSIDERYVGFDITDDYPDHKDDGHYNGKATNWPLVASKTNTLNFEIVESYTVNTIPSPKFKLGDTLISSNFKTNNCIGKVIGIKIEITEYGTLIYYHLIVNGTIKTIAEQDVLELVYTEYK